MYIKKASFRFYEELNDFLKPILRKKTFEFEFKGNPSVKDVIEAIGVPHTEIDLILVDGKSVGFDHILKDKSQVSVYPVFESFDISKVTHLRSKPLRDKKFILDVHLGKLALSLRILGINSIYKNNIDDKQIIKIALSESRTILTRDLGILKNGNVTHGYYVRETNTDNQVREIINRFQLNNFINPLSRCLKCNNPLEVIDKEKIEHLLQPNTKKHFHDFYYCSVCEKVYWRGSHYQNIMKKLMNWGVEINNQQ
ncbi:MAG: Mut7-C ubiquitin/RNAse domain-containing protein [Melioribacteraceae bacterium]|nr:Mut7-C ubiquitin/RNAse domain-containing protein [Melioribacteraceae bacterium]MCF8354035.1 Mut7-C ubiquitin/RNAse domain-containing protein [Melioribacteraceae bacterium]MCF8392284.1 Mut7-C ubiquitin/RNAse domain-containing protein [Melioribacteraceae bacterium]MCF8417616.1 Mut7-C ubiquitin/RNAse domain-containing protein [Melioribacteraceae bacterium]